MKKISKVLVTIGSVTIVYIGISLILMILEVSPYDDSQPDNKIYYYSGVFILGIIFVVYGKYLGKKTPKE